MDENKKILEELVANSLKNTREIASINKDLDRFAECLRVSWPRISTDIKHLDTNIQTLYKDFKVLGVIVGVGGFAIYRLNKRLRALENAQKCPNSDPTFEKDGEIRVETVVENC